MRLKLFTVLLLGLMAPVQAQHPINGSDNLLETLRNGLNAIPDLQVGGVSGNFQYRMYPSHNGVHFVIEGQGSLGALTISMPDGKTFRYVWNEKDGFVCPDLPADRTALNRIGATAVNLVPSEATVLGSALENSGAEGVVSLLFEGKAFSGLLPAEKLSAYGTAKNKEGNPSFLGSAKEVQNLLAVNPYLSVRFSGLSPTSESGYRRSVETVRRAYTEWMQSPQQQNGGSQGNAPSATTAPARSSYGPVTTQNKGATLSNPASGAQRASNDIYAKAERAGQSLQQREYERQAQQRQQQEALEQATNPGGYYMEKSGLNAYFDAQHQRLNQEAAAREAREEREWLARKRREEREAREQERREQEYRRQKQEELSDKKEKRLAEFNAKGGYDNFNRKRDQWRSYAAQEFRQINKFINQYRGQAVPFAFPENNCHYVQTIERIQNTSMPNEYKDVLIRNVLKVRLEYYLFFMDNGYVSENWKAGKDDLHYEEGHATCGNYLDAIASSLTVHKVEGDYDRTTSGYGSYYNYDIGGMDARYVENDPLNIRSERNYQVPIGAYPMPASFKEEARGAGITMHERQLGDASGIALTFHKKTFDWSRGAYYHDKEHRYSDGLGYTSTPLAGKPELIRAEIEKIYDFHELKQKFRLNGVEDERNLMYLSYHTGDKARAYDHFMRYATVKYGSWHLMLEALRSNTLEDLKSSSEQPVTTLAFATLLMDQGHYDSALDMVGILQEIAKKLEAKDKNKALAVKNAAQSLHNKIAFRQGAYAQMVLPKDESAIKDYHKKTDAFFKFIPAVVKGGDAAKRGARHYNTVEPIRFETDHIRYLVNDDVHLKAAALLQLGRAKEAKALVAPLLKYYSNEKDKRYDGAPRFYGDETDINAMKTVVAALDAGKQDVYHYVPSSRLLLMKEDWYNDQPWNSFLQWWYMAKSTPMPQKTIALATSDTWKTIQGKLSQHDGSRQSIKELYDQMAAMYPNVRLEANDGTRDFLIAYIQMGTALARFHEILPAIAERQRLFPEAQPMLEDHLAVLMWDQKEIMTKYKDRYDEEQKKLVQDYTPARNYFEAEVKNNAQLKQVLDVYLSLWSRDKVSSPMIPYLYTM